MFNIPWGLVDAFNCWSYAELEKGRAAAGFQKNPVVLVQSFIDQKY